MLEWYRSRQRQGKPEAIMRQQKFGSSGPDVSVIGQGTWYLDRGDRKAAVAALRRGIDLGMTHIDTAEMYGDAELVIADAIEGQREKLFLVSKVLPSNASRRGTIAACERSLKRLKTDRLAAICCTGAAPIRSRKRSRRSTNWLLLEKSVPGASAISTSMISTNCSMSQARAPLPAIRCSIICRNARSSTR
jgi:diketogulonate reductase-like aldo/keto reductase